MLVDDAVNRDQLVDALHRWRTHPVDFVRDTMGAEPDPWQHEALSALSRQGAKVSIRSCHGPGKSCLAAWTVLWFQFTHYPCRVLLTAPSAPQLETVLWPEIGLWLTKMPEALQQLVDKTGEGMTWKGNPDASFVVPRTAREDKPESLAGMHGENVLLVVDEASGVSEKVYETIQGSLTDKGNSLLLISNPTRNTGTFYESHHKLRDRYHCIHVSHENSPRVTDDYVESMRRQYGEESNVFRVRCLGEFPLVGDDQVVPLEWVTSAQYRYVEPLLDVRPVWGVDVARFGSDRSALAKRRGNTQIAPVQTWQGIDTMELAGRIAREYDEARDDEVPHRIFVDVIGIGAGVVDRLRELDIPCVGVNVAESPIDKSRFMRLRDELWWRSREWLGRKDCSLLPVDERLASELVQPTYRLLSTGRMQVEGKEDMKQRGLDSPDAADAWNLTFMERERKAETPVHRAYNRRKREQEDDSLDWVV